MPTPNYSLPNPPDSTYVADTAQIIRESNTTIDSVMRGHEIRVINAEQKAINAANLVNAPADTVIATAINGPGTQTQTALSAAIDERTAGPIGAKLDKSEAALIYATNESVTTELEWRAAPVVADIIANDPTITAEAAALAQSDAGLVRKTDPGIPLAKATDSELSYYAASADASGNVVEAIRHDGVKAFPRAEIGGAVTEFAESTDYVKATTDQAGNLWEDALDLNGKVPAWVLAEWVSRMSINTSSGWEGKSILVLGTSITARPGGFVDQLGELIGATVINKGEGSSGIVFDYSKESRGKSLSATVAELAAATGGSTFADQSYEQRVIPYLDGTLASVDHVHIDHAYNDRGYTLGAIDSTDKATFYGAMNFLLGQIIATKPTVTISLQTPASLYTPYGQGLNSGSSEKRAAILELSRKWGVKVYDVTLESQLSDVQAGTWIADTAHPDGAWHTMIAPRVAAFFRTLTPSS